MKNKIFTDNGFLTKEAVEDFETYLDKEINLVLSNTRNENELRVLGSLMCKRVQDKVLEHITRVAQEEKRLNDMTDEQFYSFLKEKYGDAWGRVALTAAELKRVPELTDEQIEKSREEGRAARRAMEAETPFVFIDPNIRFR